MKAAVTRRPGPKRERRSALMVFMLAGRCRFYP